MAEKEAEFPDSPSGWAKRWSAEFGAAKKSLESWRKKSREVTDRYLGRRDRKSENTTQWNVFTTNVQTMLSMLYGQTPKASAKRRFADSEDDVARVAGEMLERILNTDIESDGDGYTEAIGLALQDRFLSGLSNVRVRYELETGEEEVEAVTGEAGEVLAEGYTRETRESEEVEILYVHPDDQLWSPCRLWSEVRWWAFRAEMTRDALVRRFGDSAKTVPLNARKKSSDEKRTEDPWDRAAVWEIWDKEHGKVFWYVEGHPVTLDQQDDPMGLEGFFPFPRPMMANLSTSELVPTPDYCLTEDLYKEVDLLSTRITVLEQAVRVAGVYDKASAEVKGLLGDGRNQGNVLVPVERWAAFAERGGIKGVIDWLPIEQIAQAIVILSERRRELLDGIYQLTGMSDIMRGQATQAGASATEQAIKSRFASVRVQALQDEFARFCTDLLKLKAELISKHFAVETIVQQANMGATPDAAMAMQAAELLKSDSAQWRIEVSPETISMQDFAALKSERTEVLLALSTFMQAAAPLMAQSPGSTPFLLRMLQWSLAGVKGSSEIEGVLDQAIAAAEAAGPQQQQQGDGQAKLQLQQMKGQQDMAKEQAKLQSDLVRIQAEVQADAQREETQAAWNVREHTQKALITQATKPTKPGGVP